MLIQMLHMLQRKRSNCTLVVTDPSQDLDGYLYIQDGDVVAAAFDTSTGIAAATAMIAWEEPAIAVYSLPQGVIANVPPDARGRWLQQGVAVAPSGASAGAHAAPAPVRPAVEYIVASEAPSHRPPAPFAPTTAYVSYGSMAERNDQQEYPMVQVQEALKEMMTIDGAISVALVDWTSGMALGSISNGLNTEVAAAGNANVIRAKQGVLRDLGLSDRIEDILITLDTQYHLIRGLVSNPNLFMYLVLNRAHGNLAMARYQLSQIEKKLVV